MSAPAGCRLIGHWRITKADLWDRDHLDLCGPAMLDIGDKGHGEIAFGALQAGLDLEYSRSSRGTDMRKWTRRAVQDRPNTLEIEFAYHLGDEAILKAQRHTSSTAC
jgi:hypothetical protein